MESSPVIFRFPPGQVIPDTHLRVEMVTNEKASTRATNYLYVFTCVNVRDGVECGAQVKCTTKSARNMKMCAHCRVAAGLQQGRGAQFRAAKKVKLTELETKLRDAIIRQRIRASNEQDMEISDFLLISIAEEATDMLTMGRKNNYADVMDLLWPKISRETYGTTALGMAMRGPAL